MCCLLLNMQTNIYRAVVLFEILLTTINRVNKIGNDRSMTPAHALIYMLYSPTPTPAPTPTHKNTHTSVHFII